MLAHGEKETTKAHLEFLKNVIPIFEEFLTLFQRSTPTIHMVYDMMCRTLIKLMCRFLKSDTVKGKWGSDLPKLPCDHVGEQLNDADVAIGDRARGILRLLKKDKERGFVLGVRAFFCAAITHLQCKLLLQNNLLQDLGYLHPKQLERRRTQSAIQNVARKLQPEIDVSVVSDEWKALQSDSDIDSIDKEQRIEHYWNDVLALKSVANTNRYTILPCVIKSGLVLAQMNAESERSLSINARVVTKERCALGDTTICGLRAVKDAVRFYDPVGTQPEKIPVTKAMKACVRSAHAKYQAKLEQVKIEEAEKREQARQKSDEEDRLRKEKEQMVEKKQTLAHDEESLNTQEKVATDAINQADELLNDATQKLHVAINEPSMNQQSVKVAATMLDVAKTKRVEAMQRLQKINEKQKVLESKKNEAIGEGNPIPRSYKNKGWSQWKQ